MNKKDRDGATCLMYAAMRGQLAIAELLVDSGAQVDTQDDKSGWTALMQATYYGSQAIARMLLDQGADIGIQANNGCTAFDIASIIGDTDVVRLLASAGMRAPVRIKRAGGSSPVSYSARSMGRHYNLAADWAEGGFGMR